MIENVTPRPATEIDGDHTVFACRSAGFESTVAKARIAVLGGKLYSSGGIETHIRHYCRQMALAGHDMTLIATDTKYPAEWIAELTSLGVTVRTFPCRGGPVRSVFHYLRCLFAVFRLRSRVDVLYTNGTSGFARVVRSLFPRRVTWVHHHHVEFDENTRSTLTRGQRATLREADEVLACTPDHASAIVSAFSRNGHTTALPYFKSEGTYTPRPGSRRPTVVGFFGLVRRVKGIPYLLEAASWFRENDFVCRIHGPDYEGLLTGPLPDGVEWVGAYHSDEQLNAMMANVDIVVIPSVGGEGLPLVFTEAISRGVPVVGFDGGGMKSLVGIHPGVAITPPDVSALKAELVVMRDRLAADPALGSSLVETYQRMLGNHIPLSWWRDLTARAKG